MPIPERPQALQRQSAKSVVYQTVCDWIIPGVMKPGEKILDSELASYFNVSRTPVREALQLLQNQKLVCVIPGRTTVVADLDVEDFEKCYRPLAEIDALAAELACKNAVAVRQLPAQERLHLRRVPFGLRPVSQLGVCRGFQAGDHPQAHKVAGIDAVRTAAMLSHRFKGNRRVHILENVHTVVIGIAFGQHAGL